MHEFLFKNQMNEENQAQYSSKNIVNFTQSLSKQAFKLGIYFYTKNRINGQIILFLAGDYKKAKWQPWCVIVASNNCARRARALALFIVRNKMGMTWYYVSVIPHYLPPWLFCINVIWFLVCLIGSFSYLLMYSNQFNGTR